MRVRLVFRREGGFKVPIFYNEALQGFIYHHLDESLAEFVHQKGFYYGKRAFKLFTFSRLIGRLIRGKKTFRVLSSVSLVVSSPYNELIQSLAENLLRKPEVSIAGETLQIESISVESAPVFNRSTEIKMFSPITVYSTLKGHDGKKRTYYYNPKEKEFSILIRENILKKYRAFFQKEPENTDFSIEPISVSKKDEKIVYYKNFVIKGWMGRYRLSGHPELLRFAYDAGIGAKNSQGFGCFEVIDVKGKRM